MNEENVQPAVLESDVKNESLLSTISILEKKLAEAEELIFKTTGHKSVAEYRVANPE